MQALWIALLVITAIGIITGLTIQQRRTRRLPDDKLAKYRQFLEKMPQKSDSKAFAKAAIAARSNKSTSGRMLLRVTTSRLGADEYVRIRNDFFTPALMAEYEEWETWLLNVFSLRAVQLEQIDRRQIEFGQLNAEELEIRVLEGVRSGNAPEWSFPTPHEPSPIPPSQERETKITAPQKEGEFVQNYWINGPA